MLGDVSISQLSLAETAQHFKKTGEEVTNSLAQSRAKLFSIRAKRPRPHLDDKVIAAWNGLMISAFARAAQVLDDPAYLESAQRAGDIHACGAAAKLMPARLRLSALSSTGLTRCSSKGPASAKTFAR
jgi:uncharacterized protein YyaL (SSP411 family)